MSAALLLIALSAFDASAENNSKEAQGVPEVMASYDTLTVDESVVFSTKAVRNLDEIPAGVAIVSSLEAKKLPSPTIADIFRKEPGLSKGSDGVWATNIRIRGLGENRLVTLVNGNRVEVATDLTTSLSMFDVNDIERVEVIKGAQSSIYGSGAVGGIINIITKDGRFADTPYFSGNMSANCTSANNGYAGYLSLCGGGRKWYLKVNGSMKGAGDMMTPCGRLGNSGYNSADIGATAAFKPVEDHVMKLQFQRNHSWDVGIPGGAAFTPAATATYKNADRTLASINYDIKHLSRTLDELKFKAFYQGIALDVAMDPNMARPQSGAMPTLVAPYAEHKTFGLSGEGRWQFGGNNELTAGAEMWRRWISSERAKYIDQYADGVLAAQMIRREIPLPDASYASAGVYAQDEMRFMGDRLVLTLGGRADINVVRNGECHNVESVEMVGTGVIMDNPAGKYTTFEAGGRTDPSWSANAGALFKASGVLDLTMNLSRSYRSPALEELFKFIDLAGNKVHFGNTALKSEKGIGGDLGFRLHTGRLDVRADGYVNSISNMIVERVANTVAGSAIDTLRLDNTGRALLHGAELSIGYEIVDGLKAYASGSFTVGKETTGQRVWLPLVPPASLIAGISYENSRLFGADLSMTAAASRPAGKIAGGERPAEGWCRMDFSVHSKIFALGLCNLQLFGGVENITDAAYTSFLSTNRGNITCEPGRNFYIRANVTF